MSNETLRKNMLKQLTGSYGRGFDKKLLGNIDEIPIMYRGSKRKMKPMKSKKGGILSGGIVSGGCGDCKNCPCKQGGAVFPFGGAKCRLMKADDFEDYVYETALGNNEYYNKINDYHVDDESIRQMKQLSKDDVVDSFIYNLNEEAESTGDVENPKQDSLEQFVIETNSSQKAFYEKNKDNKLLKEWHYRVPVVYMMYLYDKKKGQLIGGKKGGSLPYGNIGLPNPFSDLIADMAKSKGGIVSGGMMIGGRRKFTPECKPPLSDYNKFVKKYMKSAMKKFNFSPKEAMQLLGAAWKESEKDLEIASDLMRKILAGSTKKGGLLVRG